VSRELYPYCLNSRRWITVFFFMNLPKTCPYREDKSCQDETCAYFQWKEETPYLKNMKLIFKVWFEGADIIIPKEQPCKVKEERDEI